MSTHVVRVRTQQKCMKFSFTWQWIKLNDVGNVLILQNLALNMSPILQTSLGFINPANIYLLKVNNTNTRKRREICSKLTIKTPGRHHWPRSGDLMSTLNIFHTFFWRLYCYFEFAFVCWECSTTELLFTKVQRYFYCKRDLSLWILVLLLRFSPIAKDPFKLFHNFTLRVIFKIIICMR